MQTTMNLWSFNAFDRHMNISRSLIVQISPHVHFMESFSQAIVK